MELEETDKNCIGAGLGFVEVARKASKPIEFDFQNIEENILEFGEEFQ